LISLTGLCSDVSLTPDTALKENHEDKPTVALNVAARKATTVIFISRLSVKGLTISHDLQTNSNANGSVRCLTPSHILSRCTKEQAQQFDSIIGMTKLKTAIIQLSVFRSPKIHW